MPMKETSGTEEQHYILAQSDLPAERDFVLKHNETFALFDRFGDIDSHAAAGEGLYYKGTRFLSHLKVKFANGRPLLLSSTVGRENVALAVDLTNPDVYYEGRIFLHRGTLHFFRSQFLWNGCLYLHLRIKNFSSTAADISLTVEFAADYADIFEVRGTKRERHGEMGEPEIDEKQVVLSYYGLDNVVRRTVIRSATEPQVTFPGSTHLTLRLGSGEERFVDLSFACEVGDTLPEILDHATALALATKAAESCDRLNCDITTSNEQFNRWLERSRRRFEYAPDGATGRLLSLRWRPVVYHAVRARQNHYRSRMFMDFADHRARRARVFKRHAGHDGLRGAGCRTRQNSA